MAATCWAREAVEASEEDDCLCAVVIAFSRSGIVGPMRALKNVPFKNPNQFHQSWFTCPDLSITGVERGGSIARLFRRFLPATMPVEVNCPVEFLSAT